MIAFIRRLPTWVLIAALALAYFGLGKLGLSLAVVNPSASAVWPPTGLALAACLILGYRVWPGILIGAFLVNITTSGSAPVAAAIAVGNTLEALAGAWLVNRFAGGRPYFSAAADALIFAGLAGLAAPMLSASIGTASLALGGLAAPADLGRVWLTWWLGDAAGALIVAPPLLLWSQPASTPGRLGRAVEGAVLLAALAALGLLVFGGWAPMRGSRLPLGFLVLPLVTWAAFRFGRRGAAGATLILAGIALWGTAQGYGPFAVADPGDSLLLLQAYMATIALTGLSVATVVAERRHTEQSLRLMADAGRLLVAPIDPEAQLTAVAQLLVPPLADWCIVHVLAEDGTLRMAAVANANPNSVAEASEAGRRHSPELTAGKVMADTLASGKSLLIPEITDAMLQKNARDAAHLAQLRGASLKSAMVVPLKAHGRPVGVLTLIWAESGRRYGQADLQTAEELARLAAIAADHARLYRQSHLLNTELEGRVQQRTQALEHSQDQARALSGRLLAAREEERTEMAREIHDELGQQLTGIKLALSRLERALPDTDEAGKQREGLRAAAGEVDATIQTVRRLATRLRPSLLDDFGLVAAVEAHLQDFQKRTGIDGTLKSKVTELDLAPETSTALFRVCQEALTNVARHAGASQVQICFELKNQELVVQIHDNGRGISEQELTNNRSLGLAGMRERVLLIGGHLAITGAPGAGTTLRVMVPVKGEG